MSCNETTQLNTAATRTSLQHQSIWGEHRILFQGQRAPIRNEARSSQQCLLDAVGSNSLAESHLERWQQSVWRGGYPWVCSVAFPKWSRCEDRCQGQMGRKCWSHCNLLGRVSRIIAGQVGSTGNGAQVWEAKGVPMSSGILEIWIVWINQRFKQGLQLMCQFLFKVFPQRLRSDVIRCTFKLAIQTRLKFRPNWGMHDKHSQPPAFIVGHKWEVRESLRSPTPPCLHPDLYFLLHFCEDSFEEAWEGGREGKWQWLRMVRGTYVVYLLELKKDIQHEKEGLPPV